MYMFSTGAYGASPAGYGVTYAPSGPYGFSPATGTAAAFATYPGVTASAAGNHVRLSLTS